MRKTLVTFVAMAAFAAALFVAPSGAGAARPPRTTTTTSTAPSTTTTTAPPTSGRDPILFVHGWNSSGSVWSTMIGRFQADGWPSSALKAWTYNTSQSNKTTAAEMAAQVDQLLAANPGATKVDIIAHSMGSLNSRWYVKFVAGGQTKVDEWVSLGGPNHGTDTANFCFSTACSEMRIGSSFLAELNAGDESPGTVVRYGTWMSPCDTVINPDSSVAVAGATNTVTACLGHSDLYADATVYGQVKAFVG